MLEKLMVYFEFSFVRYALIAAVLIALCSSLLGKRMCKSGGF